MTRNWKRILAWTSAAIALFAALGFLAVPPLARSQLEKLLAAELGRPVSIDRVEFNPFTLRAAVEGVTVGAREAGQPPLAGLGRLSIEASWRSVLERAPVIRRLTVSGPRFRLVREADGRYDVDDLIAKWAARPDDPDAPMPRFSIANIVLEDGRIDFDDRVLPRVHEVSGIEIRIPFLSSLPVHEEVDVEPRLAARIDGAELAVDGRSRPFDETRASAIDFDFESFDLARYAGYLPAVLPVKLVSAVASGDLTLEFSQPAQPGTGAPLLSISGRAGVTGLELQDPAGAPLLKVESLQADGLRLEPLARNFGVERVAVEGAQAALQRRRGEARFLERVLVALEKAPAGTPQPSGGPAEGAAGAPRWSIGEFTVAGGRIDFVDEQFSPRPLALRILDLKLRAVGPGSELSRPVPVELSFGLDSGERIATDGTLVLLPFALEGRASVADVSLKNWWWIAEPHVQANLLDGRLSVQAGYRFDAAVAGYGLKLAALTAQLDSLKLAQRWDRGELLRIDALKLEDTALDLGARRIEIGSVKSEAGRVSLSRDRQGVLNVARLLQAGSAPGATAAASQRASEKGGVQAPGADSGSPASAAGGPPWSVGLGRLSMTRWSASLTDAAAGRDGDLQLSQVDLAAQGFDTAGKDRGKLSVKARVGKSGSLGVTGELGLNPVSGRLRVDANRVGVLPAQPWFTGAINAIVSSGELSAKGDLSFDLPASGKPRAAWRGEATLGDFAAVTREANEDLLRWKRLHAGDIDFALDPLKVDVGEVEFSGFYSRLVVSPEGRLNLQDLLVRDAGAAPPGAPAEGAAAGTAGAAGAGAGAGAAPASPLPVRIGKIRLADGSVYFTDNFIRPNYSASLTDLSGTVGTITPDTAGDVDLRGKVAGTGTLEIVGSINPLAPSLFLDLKASARDVDLPPVTPYSVKYLGYGIEKGKLSAQVRYVLRDRRLEAENKVVLDQLTFGDRVESPTATKLPVLFAVSLLKDRNGVIDVDMPIGGSLDDPEFSVGALVLRMIFNLIGKVVSAPFTVLAKLGGSGSEDLSQLAFPAGSAQLDAGAQQRLQALAKALVDRPALRLDLAGRADRERDGEALRRAALERLVKAEKAREIVRAGDPAPSLEALELAADEYPRYLRLAYRRGVSEKPRNAVGIVKDLPVEDMERMLLAGVDLQDEALRALADDRARAARAWLVEHGVAGDRLFVVAPKLGREGLAENRSSTAVDLSLK